MKMDFLRFRPENLKHETQIWAHEPKFWGTIAYSVIIPWISCLGIVGNSIILAILGRKDLASSTYTYLSVLAASDLVTCILLFICGLANGVFWRNHGWYEFDVFINLTIGSASSNVTVWAAVGVTADRLILLARRPKCKTPKFCSETVARKLMTFAICFAIIFNLPFCFAYKFDENGNIVTTDFVNSTWYIIQSWLQLIIFALAPATFLLVGNLIMCYYIRKEMRRRKCLMRRKLIRNKNQDQTRLTVTLVGIVFMFLIGEIPKNLVSRRTAVSILYGGDFSKRKALFLERFRICTIILEAISSSANFILYCLLSPRFFLHFKFLLTGKVGNGQLKTKIMTIQHLTPNSLSVTSASKSVF